ncbi:TcfC E-set like domain-containing protein [Sphingomicrobium lutaoense]|uniref:Outer membrane usher protein FimD/PapC n=1 Tax=Sphingomicrobium lutaoense TaxID=515949 RepID=A0A839Z084_9SPHN|nr:TcfC E-set like domain-containing protein [Sphingomicrobium lutaoense]MBB3763457.1 hypothetical protein [Sphingomicrobium lutaoense]
MRRFLYAVACVLAASAQPGIALGAGIQSPPEGFEDLAEQRLLIVDLYYGGKNIGQVEVILENGKMKFSQPSEVADLIPLITNREKLKDLLAQPLAQNSNLACGNFNSSRCGRLEEDGVGVIVHEDQFRVDLFLSPEFYPDQATAAQTFVSPSHRAPGLAFSVAATASGTEADSEYFFQNDLVGSLGSARFRSRASISSSYGSELEIAELEKDFDGWRAKGGLFHVPGNEFTGRRRLLGVGYETQLDSRADREELTGSPLSIFLSRPARVEIFVEGRLASAAFYESGPVDLGTHDLPAGSYPVTIRVVDGGSVLREERRFFTKDDKVPPVGETAHRIFGGILYDYGGSPKSPYLEGAIERRLSRGAAMDASAIATNSKLLLQLGSTLLSEIGDIRASAFISNDADHGFRLQASSRASRHFSFHGDLRRVWSKDSSPLIPADFNLRNFRTSLRPGSFLSNGSYSQALGILRFRRGKVGLGLNGYYRKESGIAANYSFGPSIEYNVIQRRLLRVDLVADAQETNSSFSSFAGVRVFATLGPATANLRTGRAVYDPGHASRSRWVMDGDTTVSKTFDWGRAYGSAGLVRDIQQTALRVAGAADHELGYATGEVVHALQGSSLTQYAITARTGAAYANKEITVVGSRFREAAVAVRLEGQGTDEFDVMVDDRKLARTRTGKTITLFLEPYRNYRITIRPSRSTNVGFDLSPKEVTLFPGNVAPVTWTIAPKVTYFGRALTSNGEPLVRHMLRSSQGIGQTDDHGFFQIDATPGETVVAQGQEPCRIDLPPVDSETEFKAFEEIICAP